MPPGHARPAALQAAGQERVLRRQARLASAGRGHGRARAAPRRRAPLHGEGGQGAGDDLPVSGHGRGAGPRSGAVHDLLHALPWPARQGRGHRRPARLQAPLLVPRRPVARGAAWLLLRRDDERLRCDVGLFGPGRHERPLGDRGLHPRPPDQPARSRVRAVGEGPRRGREERLDPAAGPRVLGAALMPTFTHPVPSRVERLQRGALAAAVLGGVACLAGGFANPAQLYRSWLFAYLFWVNVGIGCLSLVMIHHLSGGMWGLVIRRILEAGTRTMYLAPLLFLPVVLGMGELFAWARPESAADPLLRHKAAYLNTGFFLARAAFYFAVWAGLAYLLNRLSARLDAGPDQRVSRRLRGVSGAGLL